MKTVVRSTYTRCEGKDFIHVAQDKEGPAAVVSTVMNIRVLKIIGYFFTS